MKSFVIANLLSLTLASVAAGQCCMPVLIDSCPNAPAINCCTMDVGYTTVSVQDPVPAAVPIEPSSVLSSPAPAVTMSSTAATEVTGPVVRSSSRWVGGNSTMRRRGGVLGRFLYRFR